MSYEERTVDYYDLPLPNGLQILRPERAVMMFASQSVDLGARCFSRRSTAKRSPKKSGRSAGLRVDLSSFCLERAEKIRKCISYFSNQIAIHGKRMTTARAAAEKFSRFLDWADAHGHSTVLNDASTARNGFRDYGLYLHEQVNNNSLSNNYAVGCQKIALAVLSGVLGVDDLHIGINLMYVDSKEVENTEPPSEDVQAKVLSLCDAVFTGVSEFVLGDNKYPFLLSVPKYLGWKNNSLWVFPTTRWCMTPNKIAERGTLPHACWGYNYESGCVSDIDEIPRNFGAKAEGSGHRKWSAKQAIQCAQRALLIANADSNCGRRRQLAFLAHNAFVLLFLANVGMNMANIQQLSWGDSYAVGAERQGFRSIKWRAGGLNVSFEIQFEFLPKFKRYLELRKYLLGSTAHNRLFLGYRWGDGGRTILDSVHGNMLVGLYKSLRLIDENLPKVMSRKWRAGKSDWLLRGTDISTTADMLQTSEATVKKHYAAGSPTTATIELSNFFEQVADVASKNAVLAKGEIVFNVKEGPVGKCIQFDTPKRVGSHAPVEPDCKNPEGCFFCDKHRVSPDEIDTRKLISCRYCIQKISSSKEIELFFAPILFQIQEILDEISRRDGNDGMVERILHSVEDDGDLAPFWAEKLGLLIHLELAI